MALVPLVDQDRATEAQAAILAQVPPLNLFKALLHAPGLTALVAQLGGTLLYSTKLDARIREAAILRLAHVMGCGYERAHHVHVGRDVGLTNADLAALERGDLDTLETSLGLAARWAQEAFADGRPSRELVEEVVRHCGAEQAVELAVTVGYYTMVGQFLLGFDVPTETGRGAPTLDIHQRPAALDAAQPPG